MAEKNYIGSQQHWEDSINADYDESERRYKEQVDNREQIDDREPQYTTPPDKVEGGKEGVDEEAKALVDKFLFAGIYFVDGNKGAMVNAKQCALINLNEEITLLQILLTYPELENNFFIVDEINDLQKIKLIIEKM